MSTRQTIHCTTARQAEEAHFQGRRWRLRCVYVGYNGANAGRHSDKFWQLEGADGRVTRRWGRRGSNGQTKVDTLLDGLEKFHDKRDGGYRVSVA